MKATPVSMVQAELFDSGSQATCRVSGLGLDHQAFRRPSSFGFGRLDAHVLKPGPSRRMVAESAVPRSSSISSSMQTLALGSDVYGGWVRADNDPI